MLDERYRVGRVIGAGGMGAVYDGTDLEQHTRVAIKVVPFSGGVAHHEQQRVRFTREAEAMAKLTHSAIPRIYAVGEVEGGVYLVMEFVTGVNLADWMRDEGLRTTISTKLRLLRQIAGALQAMHDIGLVHRDIKPANIMVTDLGQAKLIDLGLARSARSVADVMMPSMFSRTVTNEDDIVGTVRYMSPEQFYGADVDPRSDLYAFCVVAYELLHFSSLGPEWSSMPFEVARAAGLVPPVDERLPPQVRETIERGLSSVASARGGSVELACSTWDVLFDTTAPPNLDQRVIQLVYAAAEEIPDVATARVCYERHGDTISVSLGGHSGTIRVCPDTGELRWLESLGVRAVTSTGVYPASSANET